MKGNSTLCFLFLLAGSLGSILAQAQSNSCAGAATLATNATCVTTTGTMVGSGYTAAEGATACGTPRYDVWYRFVVTNTNMAITLSGIGSGFTLPRLQLLSGNCGGFTSVACSVPVGADQVIAASGLTVGATYYIRVYSAATTGSAPLSNGGFSICVVRGVNVETSRSYINITKGTTGGTVDYLDTLEIRSTLVVRSNFVDSLSFRDTLYNGKGFSLVPGSICLRTNEGKVYKAYTDNFDADHGYRYVSGTDTVVRINFGSGATATARGRLNNTSRPSFYGSTCIVMATYRVRVYAPYNTKINFKTGGITYRDGANGASYNTDFPNDSLIVFASPGLCPNATSIANAIGVEDNGTFGFPTGSPLARNRVPSAYTSYGYQPFTSTGGPNDYYHAVANNTSQTFTTLNNWPKPTSTPQYRVFGVWDIAGDHTGAANPAKGNPPCDTTRPRSAANPCGYMLVINSAYKTDTAFTYTVSNLCPGTYYEISGWFRNMCYKCGCDSTGTGATATSGYIPTGPGDSSGVQPNIAISVNGVDYYTTGNLPYLGVTPRGSDSTNRWVKKGFIYVTGPAETGFTLTIRNNAPGGGGNDWGLDDISVTTCLPDMKYSPSTTPLICQGSTVTIADTVRSYYNTYRYYKWQRSTDGGTTWTDIAGTTGVGSPVWNGSAWQYVTTYTLTAPWTQPSNNGDKYRVVVATTAGNVVDDDCNFTDGIAIITINVIDCGPILGPTLLSFKAKETNGHAALIWTTSKETEAVKFEVEKSVDGMTYHRIGTIAGYGDANAAANHYNFGDTAALIGKTYYRLMMQGASGRRSLSHTVMLQGDADEFELQHAVNPFSDRLEFELRIGEDATIDAALLDAKGGQVKRKTYPVRAGLNRLELSDTGTLTEGIYILQLRYKDRLITRKVVKR